MTSNSYFHNELRHLIFILSLFTSLLLQAQPLTGTWLSYYYRDKPGDKRLFFYRLYIKQSNDSLYGICELLHIQADTNGLHPNQAIVAKRQIVYNYSFPSTDSANFILFGGITSDKAKTGFFAAGKNTLFQTLNCKVVPKEMPFHRSLPIIYSTVPISSGPIGDMLIQRVSDSIPDFAAYINSSPGSLKSPNETAIVPNVSKEKKEPKPEVEQPTITIPVEKRTNEVQARFDITAEMAKIELYDNAEVDNDTVSLYLNGNLLADRQRLSNLPLHFNVKLEQRKENKLLLFAHNLGSIPPNTAFMLVTAGGKEFRVNLSSSLQKNAVIVLKRK
jgi:hypothetical protein